MCAMTVRAYFPRISEICKHMTIKTISETPSTNSYVSSRRDSLDSLTLLRTVTQSAGRGQRGNSWEAEPGKNLTFSVFFRPSGVAPREQFVVSEATALAVVAYLESRGVDALVKWPNDIYVGERKICGILIEHSVMGCELSDSVIGVGININQTRFLSDAPNPVSLAVITGREYDLEEETEAIAAELERLLSLTSTPEGRARLHHSFRLGMWRGDGRAYPFRDTGSGEIFKGIISDVETSGILVVEDTSGRLRRFAFKEVEFLPMSSAEADKQAGESTGSHMNDYEHSCQRL